MRLRRSIGWSGAAGLAGALLTTVSVAQATAPADPATALRASGEVGEQADGYLGLVGAGSAETRARIEAINRARRAGYARLAAERGARIEEVAAVAACDLFRTRVEPGGYYRQPDGVWQRREGAMPIPLAAYCG